MIFIPRRKTNEEYRLELADLFPNIEHIGEYLGVRKKTKYKCKVCGNVWDSTPDNLKITKYGCPVCARKNITAAQTHTNEWFVSMMKELHPMIELLEPYGGLKKKVKSRCLVDGHVWDLSPGHSLYGGKGCPKCGGSMKLTNEDFVQRLAIEHPQLTALSEYQNDSTKVKMCCNVCNNEWEASPSHLHNGKGCPKCAIERNGRKLAKPKERFIEEMKDIDPNISIIGDYRNCKTNITCKCNKCGRIWSATPTNLLKGKGCPSCAQSIGERRISSWLKAHNIEFSQEHRFDDCCYQRPLPFDFYVPSLNTCIEYDGQQHYYPVCFGGQAQDDAEKYFELCQTRDSIKNDYCKKNHINLLRIPYWDYANIDLILEKLNS